VVTPDGNITTNGGHFWAGGGDGSTTWNGLTVGDDYASTPGDDLYGVRFRGGTTLNTGSGNIKISGRDNGDHSTGKAVSLGQSESVSITSTGNIEIFATSDSSQAGDVAFETNSGTTINVNGGTSKTLTISIATGAADVSGDITGTGNFTKSGAGDLTLSGTNTYTGDTTVSTGTLELTGSLSTSSDLIVSSGATFDLQATQTVASLDLDGTISRSSGTSALTVSGTSDIGGNITTDGNQIYSGAITLTGNSILTSSSGAITLSSTVDGGSTLTTSSSGNLTTSGIIGGTTPLTSLSATAGGNISYANNITTTGAISLNAEGNVDPNPASGNITLTTTNSDVTLNADSEGNGTGTFYGNLIINPGSGNVTIRGATIANESYQVNGTGTLTIESNATSFASTFTSSYLTEASTLTGLTIGKSTNTSDITIDSAITIAGLVTIYGEDISLSENINTSSGGANGDVLIQATKNILLDSSNSVTTNGGDIVFSSDSDSNNVGAISLSSGSSLSSSGGNITLGGGNAGAGYAVGSTDSSIGILRGIYLSSSTVNAGAGDIILRGKGSQTGVEDEYAIGIDIVGSTQIYTSGSGTIDLYGVGGTNTDLTTHGVGINFFQNPSIYSVDGDITLTGTGGTGNARNHAGILKDGGSSDTKIYSSTGNITLIGIDSGSGYTEDIELKSDDLYVGWDGDDSESGTITTGDIILRSNSFNFVSNGDLNIKNTGTLTIESYSDSFEETLTFNNTTFKISDTITGLTIGKSANTSTVTINSAISVAGAVTIYGNDINLNQAITGSGNITITAAQDIWMNAGFTQIYSTGSGNFIKLLAKRNISNLTNAPSITLTTNWWRYFSCIRYR
jgi:autotransporter-associated beta strand protein